MGFSGTVSKFKLNYGRMTKTLGEEMRQLQRLAAKEFLSAMISEDNSPVPIWTGMSRGSLQPLGRYLNVRVPIPASSIKQVRKDRSPAHGRLEQAFSFSSKNFRYTFNFRTFVKWFRLHDVKWKNWGALDAGRAAYKAYIKANLKSRIPKVNRYLTKTRIRF